MLNGIDATETLSSQQLSQPRIIPLEMFELGSLASIFGECAAWAQAHPERHLVPVHAEPVFPASSLVPASAGLEIMYIWSQTPIFTPQV